MKAREIRYGEPGEPAARARIGFPPSERPDLDVVLTHSLGLARIAVARLVSG